MSLANLFSPAIALMRRQRYHYKFVVVGIGVVAAVLFLLASLSLSLWSAVEGGRRELRGLEVVKPSLHTIQLVQQHRGLALAALAGDAAAKTAADAKAVEVAATLQRVDQMLQAAGLAPELTAHWTAVKEGWSGLASDWPDLVRPVALSMYEELINSALKFVYAVGDGSGIATDPALDSYYLLGMSIYAMPEMIELVGRVGDAAADTYARKAITEVQRAEFANRQGVIGRVATDLGARLDRAAGYNDAIKPTLARFQEKFLAGVQEILTIIDGDFSTGRLANPPQLFAGKSSALLDMGYDLLNRELLPTAEQLVLARLNRLQAEFTLSISIALALLVVCGYLSAGAYFAVMGDLGGLSQAAERFGQGDFEARVAVTSRDELAVVGNGFNTMADSLNTLIGRIKARTADIQAMLENIPQGILTIVGTGRVHPEYSAFLETVFETREIAGREAMDLLFADSDLGPDAADQLRATIASCLGEERMNFDFNAHLLPGEFVRRFGAQREKILELVWSPICDEQGNVDKLMVCVRDVTQLRALAAEAGRQKRELEIIGQILAVSQEKFHEFVDSASRFLAENEALIRASDANRPEIIGQLFRNMHTIKGNARTYGLLHLTNLIHEAEQSYDRLRNDPQQSWDAERLLAELGAASEALAEYARINESKLGRKGPGRRAGVERYAMVPKDALTQMLQRLAAVPRDDLSALQTALREIELGLSRIGTETTAQMLAGIFDSLPSLAAELGKAPPRLLIDDHGIVVRTQISDLLRNIFMHLYRNALDHGIESPAERLARGKPAAGTIALELTLGEGRLRFALRDDGRGLALAAVRRKAIEKGLLADPAAPAEAVAQMIFAPGFSTAEAVTEISGRGVGMDAVKSFVEREHGSIRLRFLDADEQAEFRPFETLIEFPDKFAVPAA